MPLEQEINSKSASLDTVVDEKLYMALAVQKANFILGIKKSMASRLVVVGQAEGGDSGPLQNSCETPLRSNLFSSGACNVR